MPDERAMAEGVNLAYDPDEDPAATPGEAQAWKHGHEVGRAERAYEAAGRAEAPDADEEVLRLKLLSHVDAESRPRALELLEALIAYRERRYRNVVQWAQEAYQHRFDEVQLPRDIAEGLGAALRALSERSDG